MNDTRRPVTETLAEMYATYAKYDDTQVEEGEIRVMVPKVHTKPLSDDVRVKNPAKPVIEER